MIGGGRRGGVPRSGAVRAALVLAPLLATALLLPHPAAAQRPRPHWLAFRADLGTELPRGDADRLFQGNPRAEFSLLLMPERMYPFHAGLGVSWVSFPVEPEYSQEPWNYVGPHLGVGVTFRDRIPVPLYLEGRLIARRLRPAEEQLWRIDSNDYREELPYPQVGGIGLEGVVGLELPLSGKIFADVSGRVAQFPPRRKALSSARLEEVVQGAWTLGLQAGIVWFP